MELGGVKPTLPVTILRCCRHHRRRQRHPLPRKRALLERNLPSNFRCATMQIPETCPAPGDSYYPEMGMIISPCPRESFTAGTMDHRRHHHRRHLHHRRDDGTSSHPILDHHDGHRDPGSCGGPPMPILLRGTTIQLRLSIRTCGALTCRTCSRSEMSHRAIPQVGILL